VDKVFAAGWKSMKLYFMIGLPEETQEDLEGIIDLGYQALRAAKHRGQVTVSLSTFVPKPHTPFQWHQQISLTDTYAKQEFVRQRIRSRNLAVKWHDARMSMLEGLFSRGDEKLGILLETAFRKGCRFDGWSDLFRFDLWQEAIAEAGIDPENYLRERDSAETLPWDNIDCGVSREFLLAEKQKAITTEATEDCRFDKCQNCGACDFSTTKNVFADKGDLPKPVALAFITSAGTDGPVFEKPVSVSAFQQPHGPEKNYRLTFTKIDRSRYLSHLELSSALLRALRRSSLSLSYSAGFHPHPKISFATATSVGMESAQEFVDVTAREYCTDFDILKKEINAALPRGVAVLEIRLLSYAEKALAQALLGFVYELGLPADIAAEDMTTMQEKLNNFLAAASFNIQRISKGKSITKDIRPFVQSAILDPLDKKITLSLLFAQNGSVRPTDIITHVLGFAADEAGKIRVIKTKTVLG
jgi:radical SAM-linked protein